MPPEDSEKYPAWLEKMNKIHNIAEIIIAKQRHGPIGKVKLFYDGPLVKFGNLSKENDTYDVAA